MVIKREVSYGIVRGLSEFLNCDELRDFTVTVGETKFGCHKLLLAACSGFFRGLFRSGMNETKHNSATLKDISSETFQLLLEALYTGRGILNNDNVIDIWIVAHKLQVTFMVTECEMFVLKSLSLENYIQYFHYGRLLSSELVTNTVWKFILQHCNSFFKTSCFLELPFHEILSLIKSQDLVINTEDDVLEAVLKWVEYKPMELQNDANGLHGILDNIHTMSPDIKRIKGSETNIEHLACSSMAIALKDDSTLNNVCMSGNNVVPCEKSVPNNKTGLSDGTSNESDNRKQHLFELISNTRTCLVSHGCLKMLFSHPLISESKQVMDVITRAIFYQLQIGQRNGQWPIGATHRNKSEHENVALSINNNFELMVYSFSKNKWNKYKTITPFDNDMMIQMVTVGNSLYSLCVKHDNDEDYDTLYKYPLLVYFLNDLNQWSMINVSLELVNNIFFVVAVNECIYISQMKKFWKLNPSLPKVVPLCDLPVQTVNHLTYFDKNILAFYSVFPEGSEAVTAVLNFDISNNTWTRLSDLDGPSCGMTSFKGDHSTYLLQLNGNLWKQVKPQSGVVDFELVAKLWRCGWPLRGAVIFLDELYIYGVESDKITDDPLQLKSLPGLFKKIIYLQSPHCINAKFVPFTVDRKRLVSMY